MFLGSGGTGHNEQVTFVTDSFTERIFVRGNEARTLDWELRISFEI